MKQIIKKAFTLVELVIVIAIIAVLSAVSVVTYLGVTDSANRSESEQVNKQVLDLLKIYQIESESSLTRNNDANNIGEALSSKRSRLIPYDYNYGSYYYFSNIYLKENGNINANFDYLYGIGILSINTTYPSFIIVNDDGILENKTSLRNQEEFNQSIHTYLLNNKEKINEAKYESSKALLEDSFPSFTNKERRKRIINVNIYNLEKDDQDNVAYKFKIEEERSLSFFNQIILEDNREFNSYLSKYDKKYIKENGETLFSYDSAYLSYDKNGEAQIDLEKPLIVDENKYVLNDYGIFETTLDIYYVKAKENKEVNEDDYQIVEINSSNLINENIKGYTFYQNFRTFDRESNDLNEYNDVGYLFLRNNPVLDFHFKLNSKYLMVLDYLNTEKDLIDYSTICYPLSGKDASNISSVLESIYFPFLDSTSSEPVYVEDRVVNQNHYDGFEFNNSDILYEDAKRTNSLTIKENASLTIKDKSSLSVEASVVTNGGSTGAGIRNYAEIINNGIIKLESGSTLRAIGLISGSGRVIALKGSNVIEYFSMTGFIGGMQFLLETMQSTQSTTDPQNNAYAFPMQSYKIQNIRQEVSFNYGSYYKVVGIVNGGEISNDLYLSMSLNFFGPAQEKNAIFLMNEYSTIIKKSNGSSMDIVLKEGQIDFGNIEFEMRIELGEYVLSVRANTIIYAFPLIDTNLIIKNNATFNVSLKETIDPEYPLTDSLDLDVLLDKGLDIGIAGANDYNSRIDFMPGSKLIVENGGTLVLENNAQISFINKAQLDEIEIEKEYLEDSAIYDFEEGSILTIDETSGLYEANEQGDKTTYYSTLGNISPITFSRIEN